MSAKYKVTIVKPGSPPTPGVNPLVEDLMEAYWEQDPQMRKVEGDDGVMRCTFDLAALRRAVAEVFGLPG